MPAAHLWALLAGEDLLYVLLVLAALLGLATGPPDPLKALAGLWTLLWMAMAFVFFAVTRFRFPVVALLLPWAPLGAGLFATAPAGALARAGAGVRAAQPAVGRPLCAGRLFLVLVAPSLLCGDGGRGSRWAAQRPIGRPSRYSRRAAAMRAVADPR